MFSSIIAAAGRAAAEALAGMCVAALLAGMAGCKYDDAGSVPSPIAVQGEEGVPMPDPADGATPAPVDAPTSAAERDPIEDVAIWRLQVRIHVHDSEGAGTTDPVWVRLRPRGQAFWLNYGSND